MSSSEEQTALKPLLAKVVEGQSLDHAEASEAFDIIMSGGATSSQIAGFLVALRMRGETVEEISAAVDVIRAKALQVKAPVGAMDIVGTGGDGSGTLNISTATALVVAGCGVPVAKHGNRALSSKSGAADVLTSLGVNLDADLALVEQAIAEANIGFLMAPRHHQSFRFVGPVRVEMGIRTLFNILGPLCNPALVKRYLVGVYDARWVRPMAQTLARTGCEKAWVVHGADGLDELSTTGENIICEVNGTEVTEHTLDAVDVGIGRSSLEQLKGGDANYNAERIRQLLAGHKDAYRDIVLLGAGASLFIVDKVKSVEEGIALAAQAIDDGSALNALDTLVSITNS